MMNQTPKRRLKTRSNTLNLVILKTSRSRVRRMNNPDVLPVMVRDLIFYTLYRCFHILLVCNSLGDSCDDGDDDQDESQDEGEEDDEDEDEDDDQENAEDTNTEDVRMSSPASSPHLPRSIFSYPPGYDVAPTLPSIANPKRPQLPVPAGKQPMREATPELEEIAIPEDLVIDLDDDDDIEIVASGSNGAVYSSTQTLAHDSDAISSIEHSSLPPPPVKKVKSTRSPLPTVPEDTPMSSVQSSPRRKKRAFESNTLSPSDAGQSRIPLFCDNSMIFTHYSITH